MTTPTDPRYLAALRARAERGTPRGAGTVLGAARRDDRAGALCRVPSRARGRLLATAASIALVAGGAGAALLIGADRSGDQDLLASGGAYCAVLAAPVASGEPAGDLVVYLVPGAASDRRTQLAEELRRDPRVAEATAFDEAAAYERFRELFADEPLLLDAIDPSDLPTWIGLDLVDPAESGPMADDLRSRPEIFEAMEATGSGRVLDLLVWPGADEAIGGPGGSPDVGIRHHEPATWIPIASELRATVPDEVADDLAVLLDRIELGPEPRPEGPPPPSFDAVQAAAAAVRGDAERRCDLEVAAWFTEPLGVPEGRSTQTTELRPGG